MKLSDVDLDPRNPLCHLTDADAERIAREAVERHFRARGPLVQRAVPALPAASAPEQAERVIAGIVKSFGRLDEWRTAGGIAADLGLPVEEVVDYMTEMPGLFTPAPIKAGGETIYELNRDSISALVTSAGTGKP
jgi:hypothetical protein